MKIGELAKTTAIPVETIRSIQQACYTIDEDLRGLEDAKGWCEDCDEYVELIETDVPLYAEI